MLARRMLMLPRGGGVYITQGRYYDGVNDYATIAALDGIADGTEGTLSVHLQINSNLVNKRILTGNSSHIEILRNALNRLQVLVKKVDFGVLVNLDTTATFGLSSAWCHLLASWTTGDTPAAKLYVDGTLQTTQSVLTGTIDYASGAWRVGASSTATNRWAGGMSELFFDTKYIDLSDAGNRAKLALGQLGTDGSAVFGTPPLIYMPYGDPSDNKGTGGNFTITGSLDVTETAPTI